MEYKSPQQLAAMPPALRALYTRLNASQPKSNSYQGDEGYKKYNNQYLAYKANDMGAMDRASSVLANTKFQSNQRAYGDLDPNKLISGLRNQMTTGQRFGTQAISSGADGGVQGSDSSWQIANDGDAQVRWGNGVYQILRKPPGGSDKTPADIYDESGKYLGTNFVNTEESGLGKGISSLVKAATVAMIGGGLLGAAGVGPMASGGAAPAGAGTAGAAGAGGAGTAGGIGAAAGDAGLMYAGADAAAAGYLGSAPATLGGSVAGTAAMGAGAAGGGGAAGGAGAAGSAGGLGTAGTGAAGGSSGLGGLLSGGGGSNWLGTASSLLGGISGAQGQGGGTSTQTTQMDPRMQAYVFDQLLPRVQQNLQRQMPGALKDSAAMRQVGLGLLGTDTTPDMAENPYLTGVADDMQRRTQDLLGQNNLAIQGNAVGVGGLGGSRQGVAQGMAAGQAADSLQGQLANLYYGSYNADANRALQKVGMGAGLMSGGQEMAWNPLQSAADIYRPFTGLNSSISSTAPKAGGGWQGAVGGALAGASFGKNMGWW